MRVLVDADACPVKSEVLEVASRFGIEVVMVASYAHEIEGGTVIRVDMSSQSADIRLANEARRGDVVVTGDYGLASMALGKGARVLSFRGQPMDASNIDGLMASRHAAAKARRGGARTRGPKPFTADDRARFASALASLLREGT